MERQTRQRAAILNAVAQAGRPLLLAEVHEGALAAVPTIGMATVYRNLHQLVANGDLQVVLLPGENPRYEPAGGEHHHHFQCNACHRVFDVHACPGDLKRLAPPGFAVEHHDLTLYGRCKDCVKPPKRVGNARGRRA